MSDNCPICGEADFELVDGAKICLNCGVHENNYVELIENQELWEVDKSRFFSTEKSRDSKEEANETFYSPDWCTFEAYNIILKNWSDAITHLGASNKFKDALFQLWVRYLQENKIAFLKDDKSKNQSALKKDAKDLNILRKRDIAYLKGAKILQKRCKKKISNGDESLEYIKRKIMQKERRRDSKTGRRSNVNYFIAQQMSQTLDSSSYFNEIDDVHSDEDDDYDAANFESQALMETDENLLTGNNDALDEFEEAADEARNTPAQFTDLQHKHHYYNCEQTDRSRKWLLFSPYHLTLPKLLSLVYLALLIADEDILLLDLIRWCREGHIPYYSAGYLLPEEKKLNENDFALFDSGIPTALEVRIYSAYIASFVSLQALPLPPYEMIMGKIAAALNLPNDLQILVSSISKTLRTASHTAYSVPPVECFVAAAVLLAFKVNFGLDDEHEEILSDWADKLNQILEIEKKEYRLFSWRKWHCYINKVDWWMSETNTLSRSTFEKDKCDLLPENSNRFAQHFWSHGIWFTPVRKDTVLKNKASWKALLLNYTLDLNKTTMEKVLKQKSFVGAYSQPRIGALQQYVTEGCKHDLTSDKEVMRKIGTELLETNFSRDRFNWLLHSRQIVSEFEDFGKPIKIIKVPLNNPSNVYAHLKKAESQSKESGKPMVLLIPSPLKSYWLSNCNEGIEKLPYSFKWLLKVLSLLCETSEMDIYVQFVSLERKYLYRNVKKKGNVS